MKDSNNIEWICTDPDNNQYGRKIGDGVYEFKEFNRNDYSINLDDYPTEELFIDSIFDNCIFWIQDIITVADYSEKDIKGYISSYYDSVEEIKKEYGDGRGGDENWKWIVAECIFEMDSELY